MSKPPVFVLKTGGFGPSGETRYILIPRGMRIMEWSPSSRRPAAVHRTVALNCSSHAPYKAKIQVPQKRNLDFWSEWGDSNSRHLEPKELEELFSNSICSFLALSALNTVLSEPDRSTVSTCSEPVYGQKCGQNRFPKFTAIFRQVWEAVSFVGL